MSYQHPNRFPGNAPGDFYTLGHNTPEGWCGDCLWCGAPEAEAPELLAPLTGQNYNTYFLRQPQTPEEVEHACKALQVCCVSALRYGGTDPEIIRRLGNTYEFCDFPLFARQVQPLEPAPPGTWWRRFVRWIRP